MKHGKIPVIFTVFLAALIVLGGCSGGSSPSGSNNVVDDPTNGVMSRATAEEIFQLDPTSGGLAINGFKSENLLVAWLLRSDARVVVSVTVPDTFTIPRNIENLPVVEIGDRAFKPAGTGTDISKIVSVITLPDTITRLGEDLFEDIQGRPSITLRVPQTVVEKVGGDTVILEAAGTKAVPMALPAVASDPPRVITPETETLTIFARGAANANPYTLSYYDDTGKAKLNGNWYQISPTDSDLRDLFNAIYQPNKPDSVDSVETGKAAIQYNEAISAAALGLFKITIGTFGNNRVELKGTELPTDTTAGTSRIIVIDIGVPGTTSSGLPTFYIPNGGLGDPNFIDDYSHIRLRVNNGAELVILADNSGYIANWSGNPCPEGNFKGGCVEVMAGGKLRDGAFEGFPLGTGAVIVNRAGSSLSVGPEPGSSDAIGPASAVYNDYYSGILIGPWGSDARIEWDTGYSTYDYLEVRSKQIATNAKLTAKKNLGLIYSVWFVGEAKLTINMANNTDALGANEGVGGDDYNFYSQNPTVGLITITQGILDKRFLINGALDFDPSQHVITGTVSINGKAGNQVSYGSGTGISGALVTYP